jgi:hypothetical protein
MTEATKPGMPFANTSIAKFLDHQIDTLKGVKTQREIAVEIGYDKPNMISMFKRGEVKVPLDKIPLLAKAVQADPAHLFRLALEQYWPDMGQTIDIIFGRVATANEEQILLKKWREATDNGDPSATPTIERAVDRMISDLKMVSSEEVGRSAAPATAARTEDRTDPEESTKTGSQSSRTPFANSLMAKYLDRRIEAIKNIKTEQEIAAELFFHDPKVISMFRRGEAMFPLDRIGLLALAINSNPAHLFRMALEQHWPGLLDTMAETFGGIATPNEDYLLNKWRKATDNMDPTWTPEIKRAVDHMIAEVTSVTASASTTS